MRKAALFFAASGLALLAAACASSSGAIIEQGDPIALVSVASNMDINWKGEGPTNPGAFSIFGSGTLRDDPDMTLVSSADGLIATAEALFRAAVDSSGLISLAGREAALSSRAYREARASEPARNTRVQPAGHRFVNFRDRAFPAALSSEAGISRVMFVEFDFTKSMFSGLGKNGEARADVDMTVIILDSGGRTLFNRTFSAWSRSTIRVSGGVYSQSGLAELFEEAIADACARFLGSF